mmetsp:Transcript_25370/g.33119  ORF Transcript_25370/g.33119 Transcript_25370/m.33119 type:complete len:205 (+) Transcript_25370:76-690(+)
METEITQRSMASSHRSFEYTGRTGTSYCSEMSGASSRSSRQIETGRTTNKTLNETERSMITGRSDSSDALTTKRTSRSRRHQNTARSILGSSSSAASLKESLEYSSRESGRGSEYGSSVGSITRRSATTIYTDRSDLSTTRNMRNITTQRAESMLSDIQSEKSNLERRLKEIEEAIQKEETQGVGRANNNLTKKNGRGKRPLQR